MTRSRAATKQPSNSGAVAEVVERAAWAKVEVVVADEREAAGRIALNLGHSLGHAFEAAAGFDALRHGEAVAYGLRAATRIGVGLGVTPPDRAERIEGVLDALALGTAPLTLSLDAVLGHLGADKKHAGGRLRWIVPTAVGHMIRNDVPDEIVRTVATSVMAAERARHGRLAGPVR